MDALPQGAAVIAVLVLLLATLWWLRRRGLVSTALARKGPGRWIETLERLPLGPQHTLYLVRVGKKVLLLACYPSGCALLEVHSDNESREVLP